MMTAGMVRAGIGAGIACVKVWDGAVNAVGIVGNGVSGGASDVSVVRSVASDVSVVRNAVNIGVRHH
jgi:hypothetical protein